MNPILIRTLKCVWNGLLVLFALLAALVIVPKGIEQVRSPLAPELDVYGYVGIGLLIAVWLCTASLASPFWFTVPVWFRVVIGVSLLALIAGYVWATNRYWGAPITFGPLVSSIDLFIYFGSIAAFMWPLLLLGRGYPTLFRRFQSRTRNERSDNPV
jgi:hypothetical protein